MVKAAYPAIKARPAGRRRRDRRDDRQQHRLPRGALRARRSRARSTPSACTPTPPAWSTAPAHYYRDEQRPHRPLHVHRLPRGARRDGAQRRRRQADLDDRAGLEHAVHRAPGPATSASGRARSRSASARRSRPSSSRRPTAASPPTRSSASRSGSASRTSPARPTPAATGSTGRRRAEARRGRVRGARRAASRRSRAAARSTPAGPEIRIAKPLDGAQVRRHVRRSTRGRSTRAGGVGIRRIEIYADGKFERSFGDGARADVAPSGRRATGSSGKHTLDVQGLATRPTTRHRIDHRPQGPQAAEGHDRRDARARAARRHDRQGHGRRRAGARAQPRSTCPRGKAFVEFQQRSGGVGAGGRRVHRIGAAPSRPVDVTQASRAGLARVPALPRSQAGSRSRARSRCTSRSPDAATGG